VNPRLGHEYDPAYAVTPAATPKKVLVIGGGPAGMECALAARRRGHEVTLMERTNGLGGQMRTASLEIESGGKAFSDLIGSYTHQLEAAGVEVVFGVDVTPKVVRAHGADVAVVATGARFERSGLPGADLPHVRYGDWTSPAHIPAGQRVAVLSAERAALVLAEHLAEAGRHVTIIGTGKLGPDVIPTFKWRHTSWIEEHGLEVLVHATIQRIAAEGVYVEVDGASRLVEADTVVIAGPREPVNELASTLEFSVDELYVVGDAVLPRAVANAVHEGFRIGNSL
jgi:2,4-dienoyl-CoA reductase (NADPH2)